MILPDNAYMSLAISLTEASLDESRKTACVFVDASGSIRASGVNAPFSGSGTTAKMALRFGRKFIGCEISEQYALLSKRRVENQDVPLGLF